MWRSALDIRKGAHISFCDYSVTRTAESANRASERTANSKIDNRSDFLRSSRVLAAKNYDFLGSGSLNA
jgi:hypothetical protein